MYQFIYPWIHPEMFHLQIPKNNHACHTLEKAICDEADFSMLGHDTIGKLLQISGAVSVLEITAHHTDGDLDDNIWHAAQKFIQYVRKREACVTFHGPNHCSDRKPWAAYSHFHVTVVSDRRLGTDSTYIESAQAAIFQRAKRRGSPQVGRITCAKDPEYYGTQTQMH